MKLPYNDASAHFCQTQIASLGHKSGVKEDKKRVRVR